ncbi:DUF7373 family lipoprotein [Nocardia concava]|uniref:DUF7373 family lipoprotein n=1 Tax=Nocardia concava TaxID=257281 RepID=UPI0002E81576|nr:hypothetical protein [Nocardia concava]
MGSARSFSGRILLLALATTLAAACGGSDGPPTAPAAKVPTVDVSLLDPGNYPVVPRTITGRRPDITVGDLVRESIRMAEHVPLVYEIDDRLVIGGGGHGVTADYPPMGIDNFNDGAPGLIAGWETSGRHRQDVSLGLELEITVLRFTQPAQAAAAANFLVSRDDPEYPNKGPLTVPGYPAAKSVLTNLESVNTLYAQDDYLYWIWAEDQLTVPEGPAALLEATRKTLDRTIESMKGFQPTPISGLAGLAADPEDLLSRTLPPARGDSRGTEGVYSPHAALTLDDRPATSKRAFDDAGVDLVAHGLSGIYRTKDAAGAQRLIGAFVDELADRYKPVDPPPGLATAHCLQVKNDNVAGAKYVCYLPYSHYMAEVWAEQSQDLHQRLSAQYELLAYGHI